MNRSGTENRSVRHTRKKLRDALLHFMAEKPVNQITAKELTDAADINRSTFYLHYKDVFDLLQQIEDEFFTDFEQELSTVKPTGQRSAFLTEVVAFLGENADFCRIMLSPNGDISFLYRIQRLVDEKCSCVWRTLTESFDRTQEHLLNSFVVYGLMGIMRKWMDNGQQETAEQVALLATDIINAIVERVILGGREN